MPEQQASCFHLHRCCAVGNRERFLVGTDSMPESMRQSMLPCANASRLAAPTWQDNAQAYVSGVRVGFVVYRHQLPDSRLRIALRGGKRCVAQKLLNGAQIRSVVQQVCGKSMAQRVRMQIQITSCQQAIFF